MKESSHINTALSLFAEAFEHFSLINHLKGMYLAKKHEANLLKLLANNDENGVDSEMHERSNEAALLA